MPGFAAADLIYNPCQVSTLPPGSHVGSFNLRFEPTVLLSMVSVCILIKVLVMIYNDSVSIVLCTGGTSIDVASRSAWMSWTEGPISVLYESMVAHTMSVL